MKSFKPFNLLISKIQRKISGNHSPIVCFAYLLNNKDTICDCIDVCKHSPHKPSGRFNYIDNFDYGKALDELKKNKKNREISI
tara:strand:- start:213 stop:461 length:249 start_codon:yes stop_codon:yes gene_type:complete